MAHRKECKNFKSVITASLTAEQMASGVLTLTSTTLAAESTTSAALAGAGSVKFFSDHNTNGGLLVSNASNWIDVSSGAIVI
jgi:hypothetical protein